MKTGRNLLLVFLIPILMVNIACGLRIGQIVTKLSRIKEDYAQVNSIRNGLLSVDVWKTHVEHIAATKLSRFQFTPSQDEMVRSAVEKAIHAMLVQVDQQMREPQKTLRGKTRKLVYKMFVGPDTIAKNTPQYAQAVIDEVRKPANLEKIKELALNEIGEGEDREDTGEKAQTDALLAQYGAADTEGFNARVQTLLAGYNRQVNRYTAIMIGSLVLFLAVWWAIRRQRHLYKPLYVLSVVLAFTLLLSALALPMIDIDARIQNIDFLLLGEHLKFTNQLLFYRSKSIMQMVKILLVTGKADTIIVGVLILLFSIVFPITKLLSALVCLFREKARGVPKWVHFFAYESGKWSMADVMVVAIFMSYIGFNGILNGQLKDLNFKSQSVGVIATNNTALQAGFSLFLAFVLFGLALSAILKRIVHDRPEADLSNPVPAKKNPAPALHQ